MECATCLGQMILTAAVKAAWQKVRYAVHYKRNIRELRAKLNQLVDKQSTVQHQIDEAKRKGEMIEDEVQNWMAAVNEIRERVGQMGDDEKEEREERESRCPNPKSRYRLGRRATEMATEVDSRLNQSFERISYRQPVQAIPDLAIAGESNEGYESRMPIVNEIMEALRDPNVRMLGLCGPGGVGKTTTAKEVARKAKGEMFETVIMVQVTDHPNREKIQREIAEGVDMKLDEQTENARASRLHERLKQEKNMLLILDDLWEKLEFSEIGIPSDSRVLLTSRMDRLLSIEMKCQRVIKVGVMSEDEAWNLFTKKIDELLNDSEILSIAKEIVQRCGGLPVRIVAAAGTLRNREIDEWRDVLQRLRSPLQRNNTGIEKADDIFRVSYDRLSQEGKPIFLLCAILSHNPLIKDLLMCSVGLGLLQGVNTMEGALLRIHSLINKLKDSNLLLDSSNNRRFAIHDVIRDVALSIASSEESALVLRNERLNRWLDKNLQKEYRSMCLDCCDFNDLPEELSCPNLQFFLLNNINSDLTIPTTFFQSTNKLKVMGFNRMNFSFLPSLQGLQDELQTLCLHTCVLEDIAEVRNLKNLTVLSLADSDIKQLPWELSHLTKLQMLDLAGCSKLEVIPPELLSSLKGLEVLDMTNSFKQWEAEGDSKGNGNASLDELKHLTNLSSLAIQIPDVSVLPKDLFKDIPLKRYTIAIGKPYVWRSNKYRTSLDIKSIYLDDGIQKLLGNVEQLCFDAVKGTTKVLCDLHGREFLKLKILTIQNIHQFDYIISNSSGPVASFSELAEIVIKDCKSMEAFVVSTQKNLVSNDVIVFHQLRTLEMSYLPRISTFYLEENATNNKCSKESKSLFNSKVSFPKLERMELRFFNSLIPSIWDDHLSQNAFSNLKTLIVWSCGFVERLIPFHVLKSLSNLKELEVRYCESLEMVFEFEELNNSNQETWAIPLRKLKLNGLPKLKHDWSNDPQKIQFFHEKVVHNLKKLELDGKFAMMIWNAQFPGNLFQSVQELSLNLDRSVSFGHGLENNRFPNLQQLNLSGHVKEVIPTHLLNERPQLAQNLHTLRVSWCYNLMNLEPSFISFANLTDIQVSHCSRLTSLMTPSASKSLVQLTRLTIGYCDKIEEIIRKQEGAEEDGVEKEIVFQKLESLTLERLPRLESFCGHNYTFRFPSLKDVIISGCERMSIFCHGNIHTPLLKCVTFQGIEDEKLLDNNLNTTIKHLFSSQVPFPVEMRITYLNSLNLWIWDDQFSQNKFVNLERLIVSECGFVERLVPFHVLKSLSNLKELEVEKCESLEMVFDFGELNSYDQEIQLPWVVPLRKLRLSGLPRLKHIWSNDPQEMKFFHEKVVHNLKKLELDGKFAMMIWNAQFPGNLFQSVQELSLKLDGSISFEHGLENNRFPNLQKLNLNGFVKEVIPTHLLNERPQLAQNLHTLRVSLCHNLMNLGPSFISFANLTDIQVSSCTRLTSLMTPSASRSLVQLSRLTIGYCDKIEEIIRKQEGEEEEEDGVEKEIVFQKLESLTLYTLSRLRSFCGHNYTFRFPSLKDVIISGCKRMSIFCHGNIHTPSLKCVTFQGTEDEKLLDNNLNTTIKHLFPQQVTQLELHPGMRNIWMEKLPLDMPFSRLEHLIMDNCDFLSEYVIPTHLIRFLSKLNVLEVRNCHAIKTIFDMKGTDLDEETHKLLANIRLKKLELHNLPNLKCVWIQDLDESTCFHHLEQLYVGECESLRNIFVASVAEDEALKESSNFVFPRLNRLILYKLPNLKSFYPGRCTIFEWPQLKDLVVLQCENLELFGTEVTHITKSVEENGVETRSPLFLAEKVIPKLESLSLSQKDVVTFERNGQFEGELFHGVKTLYLESFVGESIAFLGRFPNLNELVVMHSSFKEILPSQVDDAGEIAPFKKLSLANLDELNTIWNDDVDSHNLQELTVECCCSLIKLTPSSASLQNLTCLEVSGCHQLTYLVTNSTAKSLMNLKELVIKDCEKMEEIITNENEDAEGEITFNNLKKLELANLSILKSFCLKNQSFKFPELRYLTISGCHQMKLFCHGVLQTPELEDLETEEGTTPLEGDLNKIQLLISDKDGSKYAQS